MTKIVTHRLRLSIVAFLFPLLMLSFFTAIGSPPAMAQISPQVVVLNRAGEAITSLTDGALVHFSIEATQAVAEPITFTLYLNNRATRLATCHIPSGATSCTTVPIGTLGWYWEAGQVAPMRAVQVTTVARGLPVASGEFVVAAVELTVQPRPVVLVHGFGSDYTTWLGYLGPSGFLARTGLQGFAVGDGQVAGKMYTGNLLNPTALTNTIADNAAALAEYIENVKTLTGAEQVDLVVHSMGGLISRYYIDRVMAERDVAQLIMLGTPNGGSNCAVMLGALGLYQPAGLQLREDYIRHVFNTQITEQHDIPFYNFAGTPIQQRLFSPCSEIPNDMVVSLASAAAVPVILTEVPILHTDLSGSEALFLDQVMPLLQKSYADFATQDAQPTPRVSEDDAPLQYSQIFTGFVTAAAGNTHVIDIDNNVAVAAFGLYDPSRTLTVTVRGASGNVIELLPAAHGLSLVDDPEALLYLGYGFENPNPGPWQVTVHTTERTPPLGTEYAIVAQYVGGAMIDAALSNHLPGLDEQVVVSATLRVGDEAIDFDSAQVVLLHPNGTVEALAVATAGQSVVASFQPAGVGVYGVDTTMRAVLPDGTVAERATYLALEAFEIAPRVRE